MGGAHVCSPTVCCGCGVQDYAPKVFRQIRERFGIDHASYVMSFNAQYAPRMLPRAVLLQVHNKVTVCTTRCTQVSLD